MSLEVLRLLKVRATLEPAFREQLMRSPLKFLQEYDLTDCLDRSMPVAVY